MRESYQKTLDIFQKRDGGLLRASQAKQLGINEKTLSDMLSQGFLIREDRGIYRLEEHPPLSNPDFVLVSIRAPKAVICLISALSFHNLTTEIPSNVYIALPRDIKKPRIKYPPLYVIRLKYKAYRSGVEKHMLDGVPVKIYNKEKAVTDCFKFRNKIGKDIAIEALKEYMRLPNRDIETLLHYARVDRVEKIMRPYIEALA